MNRSRRRRLRLVRVAGPRCRVDSRAGTSPQLHTHVAHVPVWRNTATPPFAGVRRGLRRRRSPSWQTGICGTWPGRDSPGPNSTRGRGCSVDFRWIPTSSTGSFLQTRHRRHLARRTRASFGSCLAGVRSGSVTSPLGNGPRSNVRSSASAERSRVHAAYVDHAGDGGVRRDVVPQPSVKRRLRRTRLHRTETPGNGDRALAAPGVDQLLPA